MRRLCIGVSTSFLLAASACSSHGRPAPTEKIDDDAVAVPRETPSHPLDALTAGEIEAAVDVLRQAGHVDEDSRYPEFTLEEPRKAQVLSWKAGDPIPRRARVVVLDRKVKGTASWTGVVDLVAKRVESWEKLTLGQPMFLMEEYEKAEKAVRADPKWREAMARRGIADPENVYLDVWAPGEKEVEGAGGARLARVLSSYKGLGKNPYGPPVEGVVVVVDMTGFTVLEVADSGVMPLAKARTDFYDPKVTGPDRPALPPLETSTPGGAGYQSSLHTAGREIRWENWRMRCSFTQREGLVLHQVGWRQGDRVRPILYRASIAEMMVPYGDPSEAWSWRSAFDEGEYGLGRLAAELAPGENVPDRAMLCDEVTADDEGKPQTQARVVGVWERDAGFLWSHYDSKAGTAARRARELVVGFIATIGNYDYACNWVFSQDGVVAFEATLTGSLLMKGVNSTRCAACDGGGDDASRTEQKYGTLVAQNVLAPNHQHFVNVRLDFDVDGPDNAVAEIEAHGEAAGPGNPRGNAFFATRTTLATERSARRDADPSSHRCWEVFNSASRNATGHPAGYAVLPGETAAPFLREETQLSRLGAFARHTFHATRFRDGELTAAGPATGQSRTPDGLARWCDDDETLTGDVVVWYTIGVTHLPRPEEFPIMTATKVGFRIAPVGFFDRNPGLDVPASPAKK